MSRRALILPLVVAIALTAPLGAQRPPARNPFPGVPSEYITTLRNAVAAYRVDDTAVESMLRTHDGIVSLAALEAVFSRPGAQWTHMNAAFLAEVAVAAPMSNRAKLTAIQLGRALALGRAELPGTNPSEDRIEILFHQISLAVLQQRHMFPNQMEYLDAIEPRYADVSNRDATLETRFALARTVAYVGFCCLPGEPGRVAISGNEHDSRGQPVFDTAVRLFMRAAADPNLKPEAFIRGAAFQLAVGRPATALEWLDLVPVDRSDLLLHYSAFLARGHALDQLNRPAEAAEAYGTAHADYPTAQTPLIGRAAALLRTGETTEAVRVAGEARTLPADAPDPSAEFASGDARFLKAWLAELRTLRR